MADREDRPNPLREPYDTARRAIEIPGQGQTPLTIERDPRLRLVSVLADYQDSAPDAEHGVEINRYSSGAPAAGRHAALRIRHPFGFRIHHLRNMAGVAVLSFYTPGTGAVIAAGVGQYGRQFSALPITSLFVEFGDVPPPASASTFYMPVAYDYNFASLRGLWIPPNQTLEVIAATAATATDMTMQISAPRR